MSSSHEYHKAEAFVSISVTCNNNMDDVGAVHELLRPRVQELVHEDHDHMSQLRDTLPSLATQLHVTPKGLPAATKSEGKVSKPPRSSKIKTKTGSKKPSFKRHGLDYGPVHRDRQRPAAERGPAELHPQGWPLRNPCDEFDQHRSSGSEWASQRRSSRSWTVHCSVQCPSRIPRR